MDWQRPEAVLEGQPRHLHPPGQAVGFANCRPPRRGPVLRQHDDGPEARAQDADRRRQLELRRHGDARQGAHTELRRADHGVWHLAVNRQRGHRWVPACLRRRPVRHRRQEVPAQHPRVEGGAQGARRSLLVGLGIPLRPGSEQSGSLPEPEDRHGHYDELRRLRLARPDRQAA